MLFNCPYTDFHFKQGLVRGTVKPYGKKRRLLQCYQTPIWLCETVYILVHVTLSLINTQLYTVSTWLSTVMFIT